MTLLELLESVLRVEVRTNHLVNDTMVGAHLSHFKRRGMDFEALCVYRAEKPNRRTFNFLEFDGIRNQLNGHHE